MKIYTFSILYGSMGEYVDKVPYVVGIVEDENGVRQSAYIEGYEEGKTVEVGMDVTVKGTGENGYLICSL